MTPRAATAFAACAALLACVVAHAADPAPAVSPPAVSPPASYAPAATAPSNPAIAVPKPATPLVESADPARPRAGEPAVQRTVIEDRLSKVEELRVRGQLQKVTVDNKGRAPNYEVLTHDGARDIADGGIVGLGGAAGKRVWNVLRF